MLTILKTKNPYEQEAKELYAQCLRAVRHPLFYTDHAVPDTMDARFDLLLLHSFLIIDHNLHAGGRTDLNQAIFDGIFVDMDQTLREMGIGDMGLPKRMRKMMKGFNGRMHGYNIAFEDYDLNGNKTKIEESIARNVYGLPFVSSGAKSLADYIIKQRTSLAKLNNASLHNTPLFELMHD